MEYGVNTGIPVTQEFLRKIPVKAKKNSNFCDPLQNHVYVKNSSGKRTVQFFTVTIVAGCGHTSSEIRGQMYTFTYMTLYLWGTKCPLFL